MSTASRILKATRGLNGSTPAQQGHTLLPFHQAPVVTYPPAAAHLPAVVLLTWDTNTFRSHYNSIINPNQLGSITIGLYIISSAVVFN